MQKCRCQITVFFETPFWVGVYERIDGKELAVCRITFGAEPKDYQVYEYLLQHWNGLAFSNPTIADVSQEIRINPKRMQRQIKRQINTTGVGTKAQQAIKGQQAEGKAARKKKSRLERIEEKERQFNLKQEKKKQKHKGH